ncbi:MAG: dihydroneopterin aldolase [Acidimicrobiales bacterium]
MTRPDCIEVRGLRVVGTHGVLPEERERPQPFEIDLEIEADLGDAARSDDLSQTVDYGSIVARVAEIASKESFQLLEALASAIAAAVLSEARVEAVTVHVRKLRPPVAFDVASAAVTIRRSRPEDR